MYTEPLYSAHDADPAYHLRYSWAGWPGSRGFPELPEPEFLWDIAPLWETDGLRLLEYNWSSEIVQLTFSVKPHVSPEFLAARAKGRLQHALRQSGSPPDFSRKLAVRSVGDNCTEHVRSYIQRQVVKDAWKDLAHVEMLKEFTVSNPAVDLSLASISARGRYWYNLHLVLVVVERYWILNRQWLTTIRDTCFKIARRKEYAIAELSLLPDHLHLALRGYQGHSAETIALAFKNNLAFALGQMSIWNSSYYAGTFSEYDMWAIRHNRDAEAIGTEVGM